MSNVVRKNAQTTVVFVKIGTASILNGRKVDRRVAKGVARDITRLWGTKTDFGENTKFVLVTSGARELGRLTPDDDPRTAASRGQPKLIAEYNKHFIWYNRLNRFLGRPQVHVSQILVETSHLHDDPETGITSAVVRALREDTLPIINENDPLALKETTRGDNDKLTAEIATRLGGSDKGVNVGAVVFMSIKNGNGAEQAAGTGGGESKAEAAKEIRDKDIVPLIVDGKKRHVIKEALRVGKVSDVAKSDAEELISTLRTGSSAADLGRPATFPHVSI